MVFRRLLSDFFLIFILFELGESDFRTIVSTLLERNDERQWMSDWQVIMKMKQSSLLNAFCWWFSFGSDRMTKWLYETHATNDRILTSLFVHELSNCADCDCCTPYRLTHTQALMSCVHRNVSSCVRNNRNIILITFGNKNDRRKKRKETTKKEENFVCSLFVRLFRRYFDHTENSCMHPIIASHGDFVLLFFVWHSFNWIRLRNGGK